MRWLKNIGKRRKAEGISDIPLGMGDDGEASEGGPSPFKTELAQLRWVHLQESVNLAKIDFDPAVWPDGRISFPLEVSLAHSHEGLRDRLQIHLQNEIAEQSDESYLLANDVAVTRADLDRADRALAHALSMWRAAFDEIQNDPIEVSRYRKLQSKKTQQLKVVLMAVFVFSEFIITGFVFQQGLPLDNYPGLGFILALGVMVMLTAVPHFVAQGIKEGITHHHKWEYEQEKAASRPIDLTLQRMWHREQQDDRGFRIASYILGGMLLGLALPLAGLRAAEIQQGKNKVLWFLTFVIFQLGVSGYFFLREWLDHGAPSAILHKLDEQRAAAEDDRAGCLEAYTDALAEFFSGTTQLFKTFVDSFRHDSYIVECYRESLHFGRHLHTIERPELAVFIHGARQPYLGPQSEVTDPRELALDPVFDEHRSLEEDSPRGRDWWYRTVSSTLVKFIQPATPEHGPSNASETSQDTPAPQSDERSIVGGIVDTLAREWLYDYLREHFNLGPYQAPSFELDGAFEEQQGNASDTHSSDDVDESPDAVDLHQATVVPMPFRTMTDDEQRPEGQKPGHGS